MNHPLGILQKHISKSVEAGTAMRVDAPASGEPLDFSDFVATPEILMDKSIKQNTKIKDILSGDNIIADESRVEPSVSEEDVLDLRSENEGSESVTEKTPRKPPVNPAQYSSAANVVTSYFHTPDELDKASGFESSASSSTKDVRPTGGVEVNPAIPSKTALQNALFTPRITNTEAEQPRQNSYNSKVDTNTESDLRAAPKTSSEAKTRAGSQSDLNVKAPPQSQVSGDALFEAKTRAGSQSDLNVKAPPQSQVSGDALFEAKTHAGSQPDLNVKLPLQLQAGSDALYEAKMHMVSKLESNGDSEIIPQKNTEIVSKINPEAETDTVFYADEGHKLSSHVAAVKSMTPDHENTSLEIAESINISDVNEEKPALHFEKMTEDTSIKSKNNLSVVEISLLTQSDELAKANISENVSLIRPASSSLNFSLPPEVGGRYVLSPNAVQSSHQSAVQQISARSVFSSDALEINAEASETERNYTSDKDMKAIQTILSSQTQQKNSQIYSHVQMGVAQPQPVVQQKFSNMQFEKSDTVTETLIEAKTTNQTHHATAGRKPDFHPPVTRQIIQAVHARIASNQMIEVSLSPAELGRLKLRVSKSENGTVINVLAERSETIDLVRRNVQDLERAFEDMGYDEMSFSFEQNETSSNQDDSSSPSGQSNETSEWTEIAVETPSAQPARAASNLTNGIDIRV